METKEIYQQIYRDAILKKCKISSSQFLEDLSELKRQVYDELNICSARGEHSISLEIDFKSTSIYCRTGFDAEDYKFLLMGLLKDCFIKSFDRVTIYKYGIIIKYAKHYYN